MFSFISSWLLRKNFLDSYIQHLVRLYSTGSRESTWCQRWGRGAVTRLSLWHQRLCCLCSLFSRANQPSKGPFVATARIKNRGERKAELTTLRLNKGRSKIVLLVLSTIQCTLYSNNNKISGNRLENDLFRYQFSLWKKERCKKIYISPLDLSDVGPSKSEGNKGMEGIYDPMSPGLAHTVQM